MGRLVRGTSVAVLAATIAAGAQVTSATALSNGPAFPGDFPDPFVLVAGPVSAPSYYAYSTGSAGRNLQVISSSDLRSWTAPADPLPVLPRWARAGRTWAPATLATPTGYLMYYTVWDTASGRQCISVATSSSPLRFTDNSTGPLVCQLGHGGSIDPEPFVGPDGGTYLLWKSDDNAIGQPTVLWGQRLSSDGRSLVGASPTQLLRASAAWQHGIIEGPSMYYSSGKYYLFYGAGVWNTAAAAIGYATCRTPLGRCSNQSTTAPWMATHGDATGPSGPALFTDSSGTVKIAYHAWHDGVVGYSNGGIRDLWIDTVTFQRGRPRVL